MNLTDQDPAHEAIIDRLYERASHGTRREDIIAAFQAGRASLQQEPAIGPGDRRILLGDYFTHQRSGARFACAGIISRDYGQSTTVEIVPSPASKKAVDG